MLEGILLSNIVLIDNRCINRRSKYEEWRLQIGMMHHHAESL